MYFVIEIQILRVSIYIYIYIYVLQIYHRHIHVFVRTKSHYNMGMVMEIYLKFNTSRLLQLIIIEVEYVKALMYLNKSIIRSID